MYNFCLAYGSKNQYGTRNTHKASEYRLTLDLVGLKLYSSAIPLLSFQFIKSTYVTRQKILQNTKKELVCVYIAN